MKQTLKRWISAALALVLMLCVLPVGTFAAEEESFEIESVKVVFTNGETVKLYNNHTGATRYYTDLRAAPSGDYEFYFMINDDPNLTFGGTTAADGARIDAVAGETVAFTVPKQEAPYDCVDIRFEFDTSDFNPNTKTGLKFSAKYTKKIDISKGTAEFIGDRIYNGDVYYADYNDLRVIVNGKQLVGGIGGDYSISQSDGIRAGFGSCSILGSGEYSGRITGIPFTVKSRPLTITLANQTIHYGESIRKDAYTVEGLLEGDIIISDVEASTSNVTDSGELTMRVEILHPATTSFVDFRNHCYDITVIPGKLTILPRSIEDAEVTLDQSEFTYNGKANKPGVTVTLDGTELKQNTDYKVTYANNVEIGTATVTVKGIGNYTGALEKTFSIEPFVINSVKAVFTNGQTVDLYFVGGDQYYQLMAAVPFGDYAFYFMINDDPTLTFGGTTTADGTATLAVPDETVAFTIPQAEAPYDCADVVLCFYADQMKFSVEYEKKIDISKGTAEYIGDRTYNGTQQSFIGAEEELRVIVNGEQLVGSDERDYTITSSAVTYVGNPSCNIKGSGKYTGVIRDVPCLIKKLPLTITVADQTLHYGDNIKSDAYTVEGLIEGDAITKIELKASTSDVTDNGEITFDSSLFEIMNSDSSRTDCYDVTVIPGKLTILGIAVADAEVTLDKTEFTYDGTEKKPGVKVTLDGTELKLDTDYKVTYANNVKVGTATVTVEGIGGYTGTLEKTFTIAKTEITADVSVKNRDYDGTKDAQIVSAMLVGAVAGDDVTLTQGTASFSDVQGKNLAVTFTGFSLSGKDAGNYTLVMPTNVTGTINPKPEDITPPATEPEEITPPATEPEETTPPATEPEGTTPPATEPEETTPPATEPEETTPPATEPEETTPPTTQPQATTPPTTQPTKPNAPTNGSPATGDTTALALPILGILTSLLGLAVLIEDRKKRTAV